MNYMVVIKLLLNQEYYYKSNNTNLLEKVSEYTNQHSQCSISQ